MKAVSRLILDGDKCSVVDHSLDFKDDVLGMLICSFSQRYTHMHTNSLLGEIKLRT